MENVKLDETICSKLKEAFHVCQADIDQMVQLFNDKLKPAINIRYLSHLVSSIEDMINEEQKVLFLEQLKQTKTNPNGIDLWTELCNQKRFRFFSISLVSLPSTKGRKGRLAKKPGGCIIYYANYLQPNEKRFVIAHELGHIVNEHLLKTSSTNAEYRASLFAYIALLDKNNFYQNEALKFTCDTDLALFAEYRTLLHV